MTDKEIIDRIQAGDNDAFRKIIRKYERQIAATVIGMLGNTPEADDVGQDTFIKFYKNLDNFRGDSAVGTYLTRIAINLSLNELKRRKRKNMFVNQDDEVVINIPDKNAKDNYNDEQEWIYKAIDRLNPKFRSVVVLRLIDGYSTEETAQILKLPVGTVLSRLARAQQKLKNMLIPILEN